jgi:cell pole-organizing protein PopZ
MSQPAKAQEPSMEEILASIRRIIADDDSNKPAAKPAEPPKPAAAKPAPPRPVPPPAPPPRAAPPPPAAAEPPPSNNQDDIDAMMAGLDAGPGPAAEPDEPMESGILDLTEAMATPAEAAPAFRTIDGNPDVMFAEDPPEPEPAPPPRRPAPEPARDLAPERPLMSSITSAAVDSAFNSLAQTVLVQNARTLEDLVKEMLRPLLKGWLDDNLPGLVERMVRAEIERVSRGRNP